MFYGIYPNDKKNDDLFKKLYFVSDEFNGANRDNSGTVRPRHTRYFPGGLWQMIMENSLSRVYLGVHWIFDAFDFKADGDDLVPDLNDEEIGGVGLGLRIARDVFAHGGGKAPKEATDAPPITTPVPGSVMPAAPKQPASVNGCIDAGVAPAADQQKGMVQEAFPQASEEVESPTQGQSQSAYPSGLSSK
jgi:vanadium chloroperoxidase